MYNRNYGRFDFVRIYSELLTSVPRLKFFAKFVRNCGYTKPLWLIRIMLDFYLISDSELTPKPDKLDELEYLGGLHEDVYGRLIKKGIIENRYDYYSDFRWTSNDVKLIVERFKNISSHDSDVRLLKKITEKAIKSSFGIITLCD